MNKLRQIGFTDIRRGAELPFGIDECAQYPLFTPELIALMRRVVPPHRHATVARSVIFTAGKPRASAGAEAAGATPVGPPPADHSRS